MHKNNSRIVFCVTWHTEGVNEVLILNIGFFWADDIHYIHMYIVYAYEKKDLADIFYDWLLFFGGYVYVFHFCT